MFYTSSSLLKISCCFCIALTVVDGDADTDVVNVSNRNEISNLNATTG